MAAPHRFAQRMFTLLSMDGAAGLPLARDTYTRHRNEGGDEEPMFEALLEATPGTATYVKLQRELLSSMRTRMQAGRIAPGWAITHMAPPSPPM